jgi:copper chaperone NosL
MNTLRSIGLAFLLVLLWTGCTPEPEPIDYGNDACAYCRMTVSDPRYGAELVTETGKTHMFDSIECLAAHVQTQDDLAVHSLWVSDFRAPGTLLHLEDAFLVHSDELKSPMSLNIAAFKAGAASPAAVADSVNGTVLSWAEVRTLVRDEWLNGSGGPGAMQGAAHHAHP